MEFGNVYKDFLIKSVTAKNTSISGYASVFDFVDHQNDLVEKGAFIEAIAGKTKLLWQHDYAKPIGNIKRIYEDDYGLKIEAEINNDVQYGREASSLVKQKAVDGLSIGFTIENFIYSDEGIRIIKKINLMEVSIVTFPANIKAGITEIKSFSKNTNLVPASLNRLSYLVKRLANLKENEKI